MNDTHELPEEVREVARNLCRKFREKNSAGYPEIWLWVAQEITTAREQGAEEERGRIINYLIKHNDPNGCWSDEDFLALTERETE